jgi:phosphatidylglycerophosphate synthase
MLEKTHVSPNAITILGFLLTFLVVPFTIYSNYTLAGAIIIIAGLFDALDGARQAHRKGPARGSSPVRGVADRDHRFAPFG